jgi:hypothetical protein
MDKRGISVLKLMLTQKLCNDAIMQMGHISFVHFRISSLRNKYWAHLEYLSLHFSCYLLC